MLCAALRCENLVAIFNFSSSWQQIGSLQNCFGLEYFGFEIKAHCDTLIKNGYVYGSARVSNLLSYKQ